MTSIVATAAVLAALALAQGSGSMARDARGIPVISNPAQVPEGANLPPSTDGPRDPQTVFAPRPSAGDYPACTKEVTDNCIQKHERGKG